MAVKRVEALLRCVAKALDTASIPYAVIGGNAWITSPVPAYTRVVMEPKLQLSEESDADHSLAADV